VRRTVSLLIQRSHSLVPVCLNESLIGSNFLSVKSEPLPHLVVQDLDVPPSPDEGPPSGPPPMFFLPGSPFPSAAIAWFQDPYGSKLSFDRRRPSSQSRPSR